MILNMNIATSPAMSKHNIIIHCNYSIIKFFLIYPSRLFMRNLSRLKLSNPLMYIVSSLLDIHLDIIDDLSLSMDQHRHVNEHLMHDFHTLPNKKLYKDYTLSSLRISLYLSWISETAFWSFTCPAPSILLERTLAAP